jgi:hypothetical protein
VLCGFKKQTYKNSIYYNYIIKILNTKNIYIILFILSLSTNINCQFKDADSKKQILSEIDFNYLKELTRDVVDSSRIFPGQMIAGKWGPNNTGGVLIRPGGRDCYPSFWIRDYAMSLGTGFVTAEEQKHMLLLTASTQCDQSWITKGGGMIPYGAIADHIRIDDSMPIYFPGTYSYTDQGNKTFGMFPPYDDQYFFIHMAYSYIQTTSDTGILTKKINYKTLIERLEAAFRVPPSRPDNHIVYTTDEFRGVDFGFRDAIAINGDLCFTSILKYRESDELARLFEMTGDKNLSSHYKALAKKIKAAIPELFQDKRGMLRSSTGKSSQADVWSTGLAVYLEILEGDSMEKACRFLAESYKKGYLSHKGNIRHILTTDDFSETTAWETSLAEKNTYQNGAYWGTPTGWICYAISKADYTSAQKLAKEYIDDLRNNDFRKGVGSGAPWECFHPSGHRQNPVYMTTVTCPFIVFMSMLNNTE